MNMGVLLFLSLLGFTHGIAKDGISQVGIHPMVTLSDGYHLMIPPPGQRPIKLNVSVVILEILSVNEPQQSVEILFAMKLQWIDSRISVKLTGNQSYIQLTGSIKEVLWFPDICMINLRYIEVPTHTWEPSYSRISKNGHIVFSILTRVEIGCPMDFQRYPVDVQECVLGFESWGFPSSEMVLQWDDSLSWVKPDINTTLSQHRMNYKFDEISPVAYGNNEELASTTFSRATMTLTFARKMRYHFLRIYLPSILLVLVAGFSMFVPITHVPARATMVMTAFLTLAAMFGSVSTFTPPISYTTKLDNWIVTCVIFVFGSLMELVFVVLIKELQSGKLQQQKSKNKVQKVMSVENIDSQETAPDDPSLEGATFSKINVYDRAFLTFYLISFLIFNVVYWMDMHVVKKDQL